jgi:MscS family membrane protein
MKGQLNEWFTWFQGVSPVYVTLIEMGLTAVVVIVVSVVEAVVYSLVYKHLSRTKKMWDDIFFTALHVPLQFLIWVGGLILVVSAAENFFPKDAGLPAGLDVALKVVTIIAVVWFLVRYVRLFETKLMIMPLEEGSGKKRKLDKATTLMLGKMLRILVALVATLFILQLVGVNITALVAFGGAGALVIGYAGKDMLANFFGGLMIFTDRQFTVGDWISSPDKNIEGTVDFIGWRITRLITFDKRPMYVPNATFSTITVVNPSRMTNRRIKTVVGIRYDDIGEMRGIVNDITEMLKAHPGIDTNQTLFVKFFEFGDSSLNIQIYTFTKTTAWVEYLEVQEDVFLNISDIVAKHGAEIAFPTRTLEMPKGINVNQ